MTKNLSALLAIPSLLFAAGPAPAQEPHPSQVVTITTHSTLKNPDEMESMITNRLEAELRKLPLVHQIRSTITDGVSETIVIFEPGSPTGCSRFFAITKVVSETQRSFPEGTSVPAIKFNGPQCGFQ